MKISSLPIPKAVKTLLESQGYIELYPPQEAAIKAGVLKGKNTLVTTPTASGKTLVAMITSGKIVVQDLKKVVYLTPLRALANEKYEEFKTLENVKKKDGDKIRISIATGDYSSSGESLGQGDIIIMTNEKFDSVLRHGVSWLGDVKLFVADEIHLVGDSRRGPTLETILTKIKVLSPSSQLLLLSATITNSGDLTEWLESEIVDMNWRPVELVEGIYDYGIIRFSNEENRQPEPTNRGYAIDVAIDSLEGGGQSIIFAETRRRAVSLATKASEITQRFMSEQDRQNVTKLAEEIMNTGEQTESSKNLSRIVVRGAAFHHAGLLLGHRRIIEDGFKNGLIKTLVSTPTLAAGVNLPARRVVIASMMRYDSQVGGQTPISVLEYKQMCGRAGRPKYDDIGEAVLIPPSSIDIEQIIDHYINGTPEPIQSQLMNEGALRTHVLATVVSMPGVLESEVYDLFSKTLSASQNTWDYVKNKLENATEYLLEEELIEKRGNRLLASEFGKKVSTLYIDPATGVLFRRSIRYAEKRLTYHAGFLQLIVSCPDFIPKFDLRIKDHSTAIEFMEKHQEEFFMEIPNTDIIEFDEEFIRGFRSILILDDWVNEWGEEDLLNRHGAEPGDLYRTVETADWLLHSMGEIAKILGREDLLDDIEGLKNRTKYGVKSELLPLTRLEGIGRVRARSLFRSGIKNRDILRKTSHRELAKIPKIGSVTARNILKQLTS